jgi:hypothetical protein
MKSKLSLLQSITGFLLLNFEVLKSQTIVHGVIQDVSGIVNRKYGQFFPTFYISEKLNDKNITHTHNFGNNALKDKRDRSTGAEAELNRVGNNSLLKIQFLS